MTATEHLEPFQSIANGRLLHTMLRVRDIERSLVFYVNCLGMRVLRHKDFPEGRFTLVFVGYEEEAAAVIELTHNWDTNSYDLGTAFGHIAISVSDVFAITEFLAREGVKIVREAGPLKGDERELIAFVENPDGYKIELIESPGRV